MLVLAKKIISFQTFNDKESQKYLANHYPEGRLTNKKSVSSSVMYKFMLSIATFVKVFVGDLFTLVKNRCVDQSEELLPEWEASVKIPQDIPKKDTLQGRRDAVKCLVSKIPVYNFGDGVVDESTTFEYYVKCLTGIDIEIRNSRVIGNPSDFPLKFPVSFGSNASTGSFIFIIGVFLSGTPKSNFFSFKFPVSFFNPKIPQATIDILNLVLDRVVPSFCRWEFEPIVI